MRTIIQHIGPLYGEKNTGSVFGQPNGSVAIGQDYAPAPPVPEPEQIWTAAYYFWNNSGTYVKQDQAFGIWNGSNGYDLYCFAKGQGNFTNQLFSVKLTGKIGDTTSVMKTQVATDDQFEDIIAEATSPAGYYGGGPVAVPVSSTKLTAGQTYYARVKLFDSAGNDLNKFSNTLIFTGQTGYT